eukprot:900482-Prorocentrum_minimum.AAC.1
MSQETPALAEWLVWDAEITRAKGFPANPSARVMSAPRASHSARVGVSCDILANCQKINYALRLSLHYSSRTASA